MQAMTTPDGRQAFVIDHWEVDIRSTHAGGQTLHHMKFSDLTGPVDLLVGNIDPIAAATIRKALDGGMVVLG